MKHVFLDEVDGFRETHTDAKISSAARVLLTEQNIRVGCYSPLHFFLPLSACTFVAAQGFFHRGSQVADAVKRLKCGGEEAGDEQAPPLPPARQGSTQFKQVFPSDQLLKNDDKADVAHHLRMMRHRN